MKKSPENPTINVHWWIHHNNNSKSSSRQGYCGDEKVLKSTILLKNEILGHLMNVAVVYTFLFAWCLGSLGRQIQRHSIESNGHLLVVVFGKPSEDRERKMIYRCSLTNKPPISSVFAYID